MHNLHRKQEALHHFFSLRHIPGAHLLMDWIIKCIKVLIIEAGHIICSISCLPVFIQNKILEPDHSCISWKLLHQDTHSLHVYAVYIFITVQGQYPVIRRMLCAEVPGCAEIINPGKIQYFVRIPGRKLLCPVCRTCICNNNLKAVWF